MRRRELSNVISSNVIIYDDIEGVSFDGTQYIFTDIDVSNPPYNMTFSCLNQNTVNDGQRYAVFTRDSGSLMFLLSYSTQSDIRGTVVRCLWTTALSSIASDFVNKVTVTISDKNFTLNGRSYSYRYRTPSSPMYLMFGNRFVPTSDGQIESFGTYKGWIGLIYGATIEKDGVKHELVPKRRRNDNVEGFYDTQTDKFYEIKQQW